MRFSIDYDLCSGEVAFTEYLLQTSTYLKRINFREIFFRKKKN